jgi:hypothetical protein
VQLLVALGTVKLPFRCREGFQTCPRFSPRGFGKKSLEELQEIAVTPFARSKTRAGIMGRFASLAAEFARLRIEGELIVDDSFVTEEIDPQDIDFTLCVASSFYDSCSVEQRHILDWVSDDKTIKQTHLCDCYLCVEFDRTHEQFFDGILTREWWETLYATSKVFKRKRGLILISLTEMWQ